MRAGHRDLKVRRVHLMPHFKTMEASPSKSSNPFPRTATDSLCISLARVCRGQKEFGNKGCLS